MWAVGCSAERRNSSAPMAASGNTPRARAAEMIASGQIRFTGGDGSSTGPVVIEGTDDEFGGVAAEYLYIESKHGRPRVDWVPISQAYGCDSAMCYDTIEIEIARTGEHRQYTFDISAFRPPEPERPTVDLSVANDGNGLRFSVTEPVFEITCMRTNDQVWVARCSNAAGCGGSFSYGSSEFASSLGPVDLTEGSYSCFVVAAEETSESVAFCLNGARKIGPCRRE
jgi:hypothetical protein